MTQPRTCKCGCGGRLKRRKSVYASMACKAKDKRLPRPLCKCGCGRQTARPDRAYFAAECTPSSRGLCGAGRHPRPAHGKCRQCRDEWEVKHRGRLRDTAGVGRSTPQPPPVPALPPAPGRARPAVWRPAGWLDSPIELGPWLPDDPRQRAWVCPVAGQPDAEEIPATGDATPVGVSAGADDTVDLEEWQRSA